MAVPYLRRLTGHIRSPEANRQLACYLTFVAGAANAGGFLAVHEYTSHMSGIVSKMADNLALGALSLAVQGLAALLSFVAGSASAAIIINFARRSHLRCEYALPLLLEAVLLLLFGLLGSQLQSWRWMFTSFTVMLLCFIMGLQNALITKVSNAEIRTTHVTGMVTDVGIELGKLFYWNLTDREDTRLFVRANRDRLRILSLLVGLFFLGGVLGALGFTHTGFVTTVPLAALLVLLAMVPVLDDVRGHWHRTPGQGH